MTLVLLTKSHGRLDAGFCGAFMKLSRIGEYCFETKDLCALAESLAENPELREAKIFGYNIDKFWQLEGEYNLAFAEKRIQAYLGKDETADFVKRNRELSLDERTEFLEDKIGIPVRINMTEKSISVGKYEIGNHTFSQMLYYLINGGLYGWSGAAPDFAKSAKKAIESSKNPLYKH